MHLCVVAKTDKVQHPVNVVQVDKWKGNASFHESLEVNKWTGKCTNAQIHEVMNNYTQDSGDALGCGSIHEVDEQLDLGVL